MGKKIKPYNCSWNQIFILRWSVLYTTGVQMEQCAVGTGLGHSGQCSEMWRRSTWSVRLKPSVRSSWVWNLVTPYGLNIHAKGYPLAYKLQSCLSGSYLLSWWISAHSEDIPVLMGSQPWNHRTVMKSNCLRFSLSRGIALRTLNSVTWINIQFANTYSWWELFLIRPKTPI